MKINITEFDVKIKLADETKNHPNILASAAITFREESGEYITISGFTIWKSKNYTGNNVEVPKNRNFKYAQGTLLARIKIDILREYERAVKYDGVPIVEEDKQRGYSTH